MSETISISNLGKPKILANEINEDSIKVFDESTSLFSGWKIGDYKDFFAFEKKAFEKKVLTRNEFVQTVKEATEDTIKRLILLNPEFAEYKVEFIHSPMEKITKEAIESVVKSTEKTTTPQSKK